MYSMNSMCSIHLLDNTYTYICFELCRYEYEHKALTQNRTKRSILAILKLYIIELNIQAIFESSSIISPTLLHEAHQPISQSHALWITIFVLKCIKTQRRLKSRQWWQYVCFRPIKWMKKKGRRPVCVASTNNNPSPSLIAWCNTQKKWFKLQQEKYASLPLIG